MKSDYTYSMKNIILTVLALLLGSCTTSEKSFQSAEQVEPLPGGGTEWTAEVDQNMKSLVSPPDDMSMLAKILLNKAEKEFDKELLPGRILTWSTDLSLASGVLEKYIEQGVSEILEPRMVYILRIQVSIDVSCPFAIDVNSWEYKDFKVTPLEIEGLKGKKDLNMIDTFSEREVTALKYAKAISKTPVSFEGKLLEDLRHLFSQEEIVAISTLAAKVNYWARLIEAWRIKPAGYSDDPILELEKYNTYASKLMGDNN